MRICLVKATQKLLEAQSLAAEGTLLQNAVNAGYNISDIEEKVVTDAEFATLLMTPDVIAAEAAQAQKAADIVDSLPTWQQVSNAIDEVSTIAGLKVVVKKLARVVYWLAKNKVD